MDCIVNNTQSVANEVKSNGKEENMRRGVIEIVLECDKCGRALDFSVDDTTIKVEPCDFCIADEYERGKSEAE